MSGGNLAPASGSVSGIQRTIARWESRDDPTGPSERYRRLLLRVYLGPPDGRPDIGPGSDFARVVEALRGYGGSEERLAELIDSVMRSTGFSPMVVAGRSDRADPVVLDVLHRAIMRVDQQIGVVPFARLQLDLAPILGSCRQLAQADGSVGTVEVLVVAEALAARLAFETGDDDSSSAHYADALAAVGRLGDRTVRAAVLTSRAMTILHGANDPRTALDVARAAVAEAHHGSDRAIRARAHAVHAEVQSRCGTGPEAAGALDRAWRCIGQMTADDARGGFTAPRLSGFDGLCALHRGDLARAEDGLGTAFAALDARRDRVQRAIVGSDLALARLRDGEPVACAGLVHEVIDLVSSTGGRVPMRRIRRIRAELRPWRRDLFVAELDDHLHEAFLGR